MDDEPDLLQLTKIFLEKEDQRLQIETCPSAREALKLLEHENFDSIISDYQMPSIDGLKFLERLRNKDNTIPFIIFTGQGREEVAIQALNLGANRYVQKGGDPSSQYGLLARAIIDEVKLKRAEKAILLEF